VSDNTTPGHKGHDIEGLLGLVAGDLLNEPDWLIRYMALTKLQANVDALVSRIKDERGRALAEGQSSGLTLGKIADATGLGTYQRVQQMLRG
jgi:hypothetical protein